MFLFVSACSIFSAQKHVSNSINAAIDTSKLCSFEQRNQECIDELVQINGSVPLMIYSHPILSLPSGVDSVQKYLQVGEQQLIVLSNGDWDCSGEVQVTGILQEIVMGGPEGTRGSYRNYYISKSKIQCL